MDRTETFSPTHGSLRAPQNPQEPSSWHKLFSVNDRNHTYFCISIFFLLMIVSLAFPRSLGASGVLYKIREFFLIFAFTSFLWTAMKRMKIWEYNVIGRTVVYIISGLLLLFLCSGMFFFHGIEERTDQELRARSYLQQAKQAE